MIELGFAEDSLDVASGLWLFCRSLSDSGFFLYWIATYGAGRVGRNFTILRSTLKVPLFAGVLVRTTSRKSPLLNHGAIDYQHA